jgi:hypothetical protein
MSATVYSAVPLHYHYAEPPYSSYYLPTSISTFTTNQVPAPAAEWQTLAAIITQWAQQHNLTATQAASNLTSLAETYRAQQIADDESYARTLQSQVNQIDDDEVLARAYQVYGQEVFGPRTEDYMMSGALPVE